MMYANEVHQKLEVFMWDRKLNISAEVSGGTKKKVFKGNAFFFFFLQIMRRKGNTGCPDL